MRTKIAEDSVVGEAKLPFEDEVGSHPTLIEMQDCVLHQRKRPTVQHEWRQHQVRSTAEDCRGGEGRRAQLFENFFHCTGFLAPEADLLGFLVCTVSTHCVDGLRREKGMLKEREMTFVFE